MNSLADQASQLLLEEQTPDGWWEGQLSTSALSTATAAQALLMAADSNSDHQQRQRYLQLADGGLNWLVNHQNQDGGWGDTVKSLSNISTSMLVHAVLIKRLQCQKIVNQQASTDATTVPMKEAVTRAAAYTAAQGGIDAVIKRYGKDHTFSVPILTHCALAGTVSWETVMALPFELACVPAKFYAAVKMPVVSYALPALIAIGQVIFKNRPPRNPLIRWIRGRSIPRSLQVLESIQPENGGFLEATPLTSFVCMSLLGCGRLEHRVTQRCLQFIESSVRDDGSWPIDTNLATWVTTLSVNALSSQTTLHQRHTVLAKSDNKQPSYDSDTPSSPHVVEEGQRERIRRWLLDQQYKIVHPYTNAAPGGWSWIDQPGGVPDADDTPGAMLALMNLRTADESYTDEELQSLRRAANWLLDLQNTDGGWPTFCRGWGTLPFDRSSNDITAHCIRALYCWQSLYALKKFTNAPADLRGSQALLLNTVEPASAVPHFLRVQAAIDAGFGFLNQQQRNDGSWLPLWFGNQHNRDDENPLYGTTKVLLAYAQYENCATPAAIKAVQWLIDHQNEDGGWSAVRGLSSSVEETGLALEAVCAVQEMILRMPNFERQCDKANDQAKQSVSTHELAQYDLKTVANNGVLWLKGRLADGSLAEASPIGFYFAKLWYFERLYPLIFAVSGLRKFETCFGQSKTMGR